MPSQPNNLQATLDSIAEMAARLCAAADAELALIDGDEQVVVAHYGSLPSSPPRRPLPLPDAGLAAVIYGKQTVHVPDNEREQDPSHLAARLGVRSFVVTPLIVGKLCIGYLIVRRLEVQPFTAEQIELLEAF